MNRRAGICTGQKGSVHRTASPAVERQRMSFPVNLNLCSIPWIQCIGRYLNLGILSKCINQIFFDISRRIIRIGASRNALGKLSRRLSVRRNGCTAAVSSPSVRIAKRNISAVFRNRTGCQSLGNDCRSLQILFT